MRASVVAVAGALTVCIAGIGVLGWAVIHGGSGKPFAVGARDRADHAGAERPRAPRVKGRGRGGIPGGLRPLVPPADRADDPPEHDPDAPLPGASGEPSEAPGKPGQGLPAAGDDPLGALAGARAPVAPGARPTPGGAAPAAGGAGSACPADMVDTGAFCIDATEVTNDAYAAFLDRRPNLAQQPDVCRWNQSFTPVYGAPRGDPKPVVGVDWCDAHAYCAAAGKSLCGHVGGGPNPVAAFADATQSAWYAACTNGGATRFAYGDTFDASLCFHAGDDGALAPVGSHPKCIGAKPPYDQIFDLSGNAWEWEDSCAGTAGGADLCRVRGGGTHSSSAVVDCGMDYLAKRDNTSRAVGIRCCAPRTPSPP